MTLGFFLQPLLQSSASPLAAFGFHFHLNLAQGARASGLGLHRVPWVVVAALAARATGFAPHYGGSVKMRPGFATLFAAKKKTRLKAKAGQEL